MTEFKTGPLTYHHRTADGRVMACSVPMDWPPALLVGDETFRLVREGYRVGDRRPAALYMSDAGTWLWYCDGTVFEAGHPTQ